MGEQLTAQHHEGRQSEGQLDSAIARFCGQFASNNTKDAYKRDFRALSNFAVVADVARLDQLNAEFIDNYLEHCEVSGLSNATIKRRTASLSGLLVQEGMEELARQTRDIGKGHIGRKAEMEPFRPLSSEEVRRLQEVSQYNPRASAIIAIILGTGATAEQIRALNASDVIEQEIQRVTVRFRGKRSERQITLDINASEIVRRHKGDREGEGPLFSQSRTPVPVGRGEERLTRQGIWKDIKQYGERIGRPDLSPRVLRRTFIANRTGTRKELSELLGVGEDRASVLLKQRRLTQQFPQSGVLFEATTK